MRVKVRLAGALPRLIGSGCSEMELEVPPEATLAEILPLIGVKPGLAMLYSVGGELRPTTYRPCEGEEIVVIPAVSGGGLESRWVKVS